jgi:hypothetical protein
LFRYFKIIFNLREKYKLTVELDELQSYEILRKGGESVGGYNDDPKSYKENRQVSNTKHHLEDDDVYLFL